jgi:hypothetical protein
MPQPRSSSRTPLTRLVFLAFLGWALLALGKRTSDASEHAAPERAEPVTGKIPASARRRSRHKRLATSLAFATLFFAGAALSAGAGDILVEAMETTPSESTETTETTADADDATAAAEETPADETSVDETTADDTLADDTSGEDTPAAGGETPAETPADGAGDAGDGEGGTETPGESGNDGSGSGDNDGSGSGGSGAPAAPATPAGPPVVKPHRHADDTSSRALDPEANTLGGAMVWLHRTLPDPTPPARRLAPAFARALKAQATAARISWTTVLAALRADGELGRRPATTAGLRTLSRTLARLDGQGEWQAFLALRGRTAYADRAQAFARYNRAVGLNALVTGLDAAKKRLADRLLADRRVSIYGGGRTDIASGKTDVRVLVLLRYLAEAHGQVTVSSLTSGHGIYSRPGVVSAHTYGLAVDIAVLGGQAILGNSAPGGVTEHAVRNILLLPAELRPQQVISLLGMGGPSFPMANHDDHIHVGY